MALNNVPLTGQSLGVTKVPINQNFSVIDTAFSVDHVAYNASGQGKHNKVTFPVQNPAPTFSANEEGLYNAQLAAVSELFVHKQSFAGTKEIPMTASVLSTSTPALLTAGWTYLPSGIILKWSANINANGLTVINFPVAASIPVFTTCMTVIVQVADGGGGDINKAIILKAVTPTTFTVYGSNRTSTGASSVVFTYLAIGY